MSWGAEPFEDTNEAELIAQFVKLWAEYPSYSPVQVAQYVFNQANLRDADSRGMQWGTIWGNRLDIREAVRKAKLGNSEDQSQLTKEQWEAELLTLARDVTIPAAEKKAKVEAYNLIAQSKGWLVKPKDAGGTGGYVAPPVTRFIRGIPPKAANAA